MMTTDWKHRLATAAVTAVIFLILGSVYVTYRVGQQRTQARQEQRQSDVNACKGINRVSDAIIGVLDAAKNNTASSGQRTEAEKAATIAEYDRIIDKFQPLDCDATPISFTPTTLVR